MSAKISELIGEEELRAIREFLSFSEYEARTYIALVLAGPSEVSRIASIAGVPRTKCYSVVRSLISKGVAIRIASKPLVVDAVNPEVILSRIAEEACSRARDRAARVSQLISTLRERHGQRLGSGYKRDLAGIMFIEDINALVTKLVEDIERASREILIATSKSPIEFPWRDLFTPVLKALERGVMVEYAAPSDSPAIRHIRLLLEGGERISGSQGATAGEQGSTSVGREVLSLFRVYESQYIETPFIVIDEEIVYNIFTEPVKRAHLFTIRIYNPRYARSMKIYYTLLTRGRP